MKEAEVRGLLGVEGDGVADESLDVDGEVRELFDVHGVESVISVDELDDVALRVADRAVVEDHDVFHGFDQSPLHVARVCSVDHVQAAGQAEVQRARDGQVVDLGVGLHADLSDLHDGVEHHVVLAPAGVPRGLLAKHRLAAGEAGLQRFGRQVSDARAVAGGSLGCVDRGEDV